MLITKWAVLLGLTNEAVPSVVQVVQNCTRIRQRELVSSKSNTKAREWAHNNDNWSTIFLSIFVFCKPTWFNYNLLVFEMWLIMDVFWSNWNVLTIYSVTCLHNDSINRRSKSYFLSLSGPYPLLRLLKLTWLILSVLVYWSHYLIIAPITLILVPNQKSWYLPFWGIKEFING